MRRVAFVACSKTKLNHAAPAAALYSSALFRKSMFAALRSNDDVFILSALHGVIPLTTVIEPYDRTLKLLPASERAVWGASVSAQLPWLIRRGDVASFYCGDEYIRPLRGAVSGVGCRVLEPLAGLSMGERLSRLQKLNNETALRHALQEAKRLIRRLWQGQSGGRRFAEMGRKTPWPQRGLYIILEDEPIRSGSMPRVVRIGTHAVSLGSKTSLWDRLSTHRGTLTGSGSHRSSIFRSHVGRALIAKESDGNWPSSWGLGQNATRDVREGETALESRVSAYIGNLRVLWLEVADDAGPRSDRAFLERNLISLYSTGGFLHPAVARSTDWLGEWSPEWRIAATGLWNLDHILAPWNEGFVGVLEHYVDVSIGKRHGSSTSIAPEGWHSNRTGANLNQLTFFP